MKEIFKRFLKSEPARIFVGIALFIPALILDVLEVSVIPTVFYMSALIISGAEVFISAARGIMRLDFLDEKFLMCIASVGAMIIGEQIEGVAVMLFFLVGEYFEHRATRAARNSIRSLMEICPDTARVIRDGEECEEDAEDVEVGSVILVRPGERVPIDAVVISGSGELDTSALTGESVPRPANPGDTVDSGVVLLGGAITARTLRPADESRASRVLALVEDASDRKSREESFITRFSRVYTPAVILLAICMAIIPPLLSLLEWRDAVYRALSFLVVSCPCALVISVPMAFFGGIGGAAKRGVLYKGGNVFSAVAGAKTVVFDKTGTLTTGEFTLSECHPIGIEREELLSLVASAEHNSNHPIARALKSLSNNLYQTEQLEEIAGKGIVALIKGQRVAVGNASLMNTEGIGADSLPDNASVHVAIDGVYSGYIILTDTVKPEAREAIALLRRLGVRKTVILSGDKRESAENVAAALGIDEVEAELLPEDKYSRLEEIIADTGKGTVYVGDGINDAPCLARADVGIAMGERGSDGAIEASDVVIMSDNLSRIPAAVKIARKALRIAKQNIVFAIGIKLLVLLLVALDLAGMWLAVFADVGVAVLAILNSMRTIFGTSR